MEQIKSIKEEDELEIIDNIEIIQEDELFDGSFETTLSVTEFCDLGDLDDIEGYIIDDQVPDVTNRHDNISKEIESTSHEPLSIETALYVETFKIGGNKHHSCQHQKIIKI